MVLNSSSPGKLIEESRVVLRFLVLGDMWDMRARADLVAGAGTGTAVDRC